MMNPDTSMFTKIKRRTKRAYAALFDDTSFLFGKGTDTTIFPNGEREIWIKGLHGAGVRVRASQGPAGFSVTIQSFAGGSDLSARTYDREYQETNVEGQREVSIVQYRDTQYARQFCKWWASERDANGKHVEPHPNEIGITEDM